MSKYILKSGSLFVKGIDGKMLCLTGNKEDAIRFNKESNAYHILEQWDNIGVDFIENIEVEEEKEDAATIANALMWFIIFLTIGLVIGFTFVNTYEIKKDIKEIKENKTAYTTVSTVKDYTIRSTGYKESTIKSVLPDTLKDYAYVFKELEEEYDINPLFIAAMCWNETNSGLNGTGKTRNNLTGIKGMVNGEFTFKYYDGFDDSIRDTFRLIDTYINEHGLTTIESIGNRWCDSEWAHPVKETLKKYTKQADEIEAYNPTIYRSV